MAWHGTVYFLFDIMKNKNFDEGYTQQDIPSTTQRYILRSSINNSMIKCSI